ncbi:MAG: flavodoxin family protein [Candidatus Cryosericum sp.]
MNKRILILSTSPRKGGNSDLLCDEFMRGAAESGNQVEKISLKERKIGMCLGCDTCQSNGGTCVQKDDMAEILEKMIAADVIVMATPVYFYSVSSQMKALIDRTAPRYTKISGKEFYFIATASDQNPEMLERTIECFRGFTDCLNDAAEKGVIYGAGVTKRVPSRAPSI